MGRADSPLRIRIHQCPGTVLQNGNCIRNLHCAVFGCICTAKPDVGLNRRLSGGSLCTVLQNLYSIRNLHSTIAARITTQIVRLALQHRHRQILQGTGQQFPILVAGIRLCGIKRNLILPGRCALWDHHCQNRKGQCLIVYDFICPVVGGVPQESGRLGRCYPALILFPCPAATIAVWLRKGQPPDLQGASAPNAALIPAVPGSSAICMATVREISWLESCAV